MVSERPALRPIERDFTVSFHTPQQLDRIRQATLWILENVGVRAASARAQALFREHGAQVDTERHLVRLPADLVEACRVQKTATPSLSMSLR